jgi:hypothetical protein
MQEHRPDVTRRSRGGCESDLTQARRSPVSAVAHGPGGDLALGGEGGGRTRPHEPAHELEVLGGEPVRPRLGEQGDELLERAERRRRGAVKVA